ncbi:energy transducer TonB [Sphingobium sp. AR-3-1]|uniref:Energy transducer TonB n=1 Tax=Sphingobium psychrophilum TaxID=2728834 RepID=A0A7X9WRP1_9SPHN|nr:energy transducer TonB [Sphingobium psychrophilum]NML08622.1 energy transducer TonB [Sphingobium psychrophilum]
MARVAHPFRIGGPAAASLLVNGLLIAALLNLGLGHVSRRTESPTLTVLSLALLKGVEQGEEEAETAAPSTTPAVPPPPVEQPRVSQQPVVAPAAPPIVAALSRLSFSTPMQAAAPVASPAAPPSHQAMAAVSTSSSAAPPPRRGTADGLDVKAPPGTSRSYAAKVRSWLYAHKIYPRRARMRREEGRVQVRFVLDRAGMLLEGSVIHGSGHAILDQEAEAMLRRASPYPRAPAELPGDRMEFTAPIEFTLPA